jgi:DNA repair protein RadC
VIGLFSLLTRKIGCKIGQTIHRERAMTEPNPKPTYRIADLHESDRPRERLASLGPQALTNAELLAILLRVGVQGENAVDVGQRLLQEFGGLRGLHRVPFKELMDQRGMGEAKASQIKAAIELGRRLTLESPEEKLVINSPADAAALVRTRCPRWSRSICA